MEAAGLAEEYSKTLATGIWDICDILPGEETTSQGQKLRPASFDLSCICFFCEYYVEHIVLHYYIFYDVRYPKSIIFENDLWNHFKKYIIEKYTDP